MRLKLRHLIGGVAVAAFFAVAFGTLGILVVQEVERRAEWQQIHDTMLRRVPAYLGEKP